MSVKLIMTWDIQAGKEQDYFEFIGRHFIPTVTDLGLDLSDAWLTIFGQQPQILVSAVVPSQQEAYTIVLSQEWQVLHDTLLDFVDNYTLKIVPLKGAFQF